MRWVVVLWRVWHGDEPWKHLKHDVTDFGVDLSGLNAEGIADVEVVVFDDVGCEVGDVVVVELATENVTE